MVCVWRHVGSASQVSVAAFGTTTGKEGEVASDRIIQSMEENWKKLGSSARRWQSGHVMPAE